MGAVLVGLELDSRGVDGDQVEGPRTGNSPDDLHLLGRGDGHTALDQHPDLPTDRGALNLDGTPLLPRVSW
jgi:hypothetical protein